MASLAVLSPQSLLPGLFHTDERRNRLSALDPSSGVMLAAKALCRTLDTVAADARHDPTDQASARDHRYRLAMSIALPLSLGGPVRRQESFRMLAAMATKVAREKGLTGPAGLALHAAKLLTEAVLGAECDAKERLHQAIDAAIDAAVAHGALHDRDLRQVRAQAESLASQMTRPRRH